MTPLVAAETTLLPLVGARLCRSYLSVAEAALIRALPRCYTQHIADRSGSTYMRRFYVCDKPASPQVWLHEILSSDPDPYLHDHPWDYTTVLLRGSYVEETATGRDEYGAGETLRRKAEHLHRLHLTAPALTLFVAPRQRRRWGFATPRGWVEASRYLNAQRASMPTPARGLSSKVEDL